MAYNKLIVALLATSILVACSDKEEAVEQPAVQQVTVDVKVQNESFMQLAQGQMADFIADTERLVTLVKEGKLEEAQELYPLVTMYYERLQPLMVNLPELDHKINGALTQGKEAEATGFNRLAYSLFTEEKTVGSEEIATELMNDVKNVQKELSTLDASTMNVLATAATMFESMVNERLTTTSISNNEVYAVKAQTEVAEEILKIFMPRISSESAEIASDKILKLNEVLAYYEVGKEDYVNYSFFTSKQKEELKTAVQDVQTALQQMNDTLK